MASQICPTCQRHVSEKELHYCFFGQVYPLERREENNLRQHWEETALLLSWARHVSHAIFCVCRYQEEVDDGPVLGEVQGLTDLLTHLMTEAESRLLKFYTISRGWQKQAEALLKGTPAAEQPMPAAVKKPGNGQGS